MGSRDIVLWYTVELCSLLLCHNRSVHFHLPLSTSEGVQDSTAQLVLVTTFSERQLQPFAT